MTEEESRKVKADLDDVRNHYEQTVSGLQRRIEELEKAAGSGRSQTKKTASGSER